MPVSIQALTEAARKLKETGDPNVLDELSMPFAEWNELVRISEHADLNR